MNLRWWQRKPAHKNAVALPPEMARYNALVIERKCEVCGGENVTLFGGPEAGGSVNVFASCCGTRYNIIPLFASKGMCQVVRPHELGPYINGRFVGDH